MHYRSFLGICMIAMIMLIPSLPVQATGTTQDLSPPCVQTHMDSAVLTTTMLCSDGYGEFTLIVIADARVTFKELLGQDILTTMDGLDVEPWQLVDATFVDGSRTDRALISVIKGSTNIILENARVAKFLADTNEYDGIHRLSAKRLQTMEFINFTQRRDEIPGNTDAGGHHMDLARILNEGILKNNTSLTHRLTRVGYV